MSEFNPIYSTGPFSEDHHSESKKTEVQRFIAAYDHSGRELLCFRKEFANLQKVDLNVLADCFPTISFLTLDIDPSKYSDLSKFNQFAIVQRSVQEK